MERVNAQIESPYNVLEVVRERRYDSKGYVRRVEMIDYSDVCPDQEPLEMVNYYSLDSGHWIDGQGRNRRLPLAIRRGLRQIQKAKPSHCVASIGFNLNESKWSGWSHRAICSFGIGDMLFEERYLLTDDTLFTEAGKVRIETLDQAKRAAKNFAEYVS